MSTSKRMDMSGMGGMDMSSSDLFRTTNMQIAHVYWYLVVSIVGMLCVNRVFRGVRRILRRKSVHNGLSTVPSRPEDVVSQVYETTITIIREIAYPCFTPFRSAITKYFSLPSLGQAIFISLYSVVILIMLWSNVLLSPNSTMYAYKWEKVAFRAAWVSVTQIPMIYCLSCRVNVISLLTGISYERLNWLHRWAALTLFLTVTVHWSYFFTEWSLANFVSWEIQLMPMVKYGFGAWATIGWMVLTGFGCFRNLCFELWLLQHLASGATLLWLLHTHVPSYATYNVWLAVGFVAFDRLARVGTFITRNLHLFSPQGCRFAYAAILTYVGDGVTHIRIKNVNFTWKPGQHVYIRIPSIRLIESHPFTIANLCSDTEGDASPHIDLFVRSHSGFTKSLQAKSQSPNTPLRDRREVALCFSGVYGAPPVVDDSENVILIASDNRASFTVPIFQSLAKEPGCVKRIDFYWTMAHARNLRWYESKIRNAIDTAAGSGLHVNVHLFVTRDCESNSTSDEFEEKPLSSLLSSRSSSSFSSTSTSISSNPSYRTPIVLSPSFLSSSETPNPSQQPNNAIITLTHARINLTQAILPVLEDAFGHTSIVACCNPALTASLKNYVAAVSDERAVHKGTGAQGVGLWCEGWL